MGFVCSYIKNDFFPAAKKTKPTPSSSSSTSQLRQTASSQAQPDHGKVTYYCFGIWSVKVKIKTDDFNNRQKLIKT